MKRKELRGNNFPSSSLKGPFFILLKLSYNGVDIITSGNQKKKGLPHAIYL